MARTDELLQIATEHHREGRLNEAAKLYQQILETEPSHFDASRLLCGIAYQAGNYAAAAALAQHALTVNPEHGESYNLLGLALMQLGNAEEAEINFQRAIKLEPSPEYFHNLGVLFHQQRRFEDAAGAYENALRGNPDYEYAVAGMAQVLIALRRHAEAIPFLQRAVAAFPSDADMHSALGDCFHALKQYADAVAAYSEAVGINPRLTKTWYSLGCAYNSLLAYAAAWGCFREALSVRPDWCEAQHNLGLALFQLGQVDEAMDMFRQAADGASPRLPLQTMAVIAPGSARSDNQAVLEVRRKWAEAYLPGCGRGGQNQLDTSTRVLRIGYISSFFHRPNWMKPVWGLINRHDRDRFEVHLFSDSPDDISSKDRTHDISKCSNDAAAELIARCDLDLLVDLNGYSAPDRLPVLALRPAPVIAAWFNMYATSGMSCYDYLIGDEVVIPPEEEKFYCEKIIRVPGSYLTFEVTYPVPEVTRKPRAADAAMRFGCLASQYKITNEVVAAWCRILREAPGSTLLLKNSTLGSPDVRQFVHGLFDAFGISTERIRIEGPSEHFQFLKTYDEIDIALDTFPYNGGTTTTEAIWQGVPVLTFCGDRWVSRTSASILRAANLGSFVREGIDEYVSHAIALAKSADAMGMLADLRRNMRARLLASPVCDTQGFARYMERIYTDIVRI